MPCPHSPPWRERYSRVLGFICARCTKSHASSLASNPPCARSVGKQIVNVPSFMVRVDSQKHIDFALNSPFGGGRPGRVKRRNIKVRSRSFVYV